MSIRAGSSPVTRTKKERSIAPLFFWYGRFGSKNQINANGVDAGNVYRFAKQMTDFVRQGKLAGSRSEPCSSVLSLSLAFVLFSHILVFLSCFPKPSCQALGFMLQLSLERTLFHFDKEKEQSMTNFLNEYTLEIGAKSPSFFFGTGDRT